MTDPIADCMRGKSLNYYRYFRKAPKEVDTQGPTEQWIGPLNLKQSDWALANSVNLNAEAATGEGPRWVNTPEYKAALAVCETEMGDPTEFDPPQQVEALSAGLRELVSKADQELGPIERYNDCMKQVGHPVAEFGDGATGLSLYLRSLLPLPPLKGAPASEAWNNYLALEADALSADVDCRKEHHDRGIASLAEDLDAFERDNAQALSEVATYWSDLLEKATAAGYPSQDGDVSTLIQ